MNSCTIIMYHYVRPIQKSSFPKIKGLELIGFRRQLNYLCNNFNIITANQMLNCIYNRNKIPSKSAVLTFDDGFKDHFSFVFPLLKKFKIQGLFFPPAKPIKEKSILDVHKIHHILANVNNKQTLVNEINHFIRNYKDEYDLDSPSKYYERLAIPNRFDTKDVIFIKRILQRDLPQKLRNIVTSYLFKKYITSDEQAFSEELYLSLDEIKEMCESGMYFGSHSYSHNWLTTLSEKELKIEIGKSLNFHHSIVKNSGDDLIMCYPYGDYNKKIIQELKKYNFKAGLTTDVGTAILNKRNAYHLMRYDTNDFPQ